MLDNYSIVAQQASRWALDEVLSPNKRMLARNLAQLAEILSDPQYGCPAEHYAAAVMYCHLCKSAHGTTAAARPTCPGRADCPQRGRTCQ